MSTYVSVVTSPATCTWPVVMRVSTATRLVGSSLSIASRIASLIWSAILSGWPSVTDSEVNRRRDTGLPDDVDAATARDLVGVYRASRATTASQIAWATASLLD